MLAEPEFKRFQHVPIEDVPDDFWERLRAEIRLEEGGGGQCGIVTEYRDECRVGGWYRTGDDFVEHYWFETKGGWIIDPTSDQFCSVSVRRLAPGDPERASYVYELPAGVTDDAGFVGPLAGFKPDYMHAK